MAIAVLWFVITKLAKEQNVDLYLGKYDKLSADSVRKYGYNDVGDMLSHLVSNIDVLETSTAQIPAIKLYKKLGYECDRTWFDMNSLSQEHIGGLG